MTKPSIPAGPDVRRFRRHTLKRHPKGRGDGRATAKGTRWHVLEECDPIVSPTLGTHMVRVFLRGDADGDASIIQRKHEPKAAALTRLLAVPAKSEEYGRLSVDRVEVDISDEGAWDTAADWLFARADCLRVEPDPFGRRKNSQNRLSCGGP
jgi:hypothetical protein